MKKRFWVGFNLVKGIRAVRLQVLINYFGGATAAWQADPPERQATWLGPKMVERLLQARAGLDLDRRRAGIPSQCIQVLTWAIPGIHPGNRRSIRHRPCSTFMAN